MARYERIFCENCGAELNADVSQQYVKCNSCGAVINNPKYIEQSETFTQTTGEGGLGDIISEDTKNAFNKLKGFFGGFGGSKNDRHFEEDIHDDFDDDFDDDDFDDDFDDDDRRDRHRRNPFEENRGGFGRRAGHRQEYYAVIEKTGLFYKGECPGISFTNSGLCNTYEECLDEIEEKLGDKIGAFNRSYEQPDPSELDLDDNQRIVRVRPKR